MIRKTIYFLTIVLHFSSLSLIQAESTNDTVPDSISTTNDLILANPSFWINQCYSILNGSYINRVGETLDTTILHKKIFEGELEVTLLKKSFYGNEQTYSVRSVHALKMKTADLYTRILHAQKKIYQENELVTKNLHAVLEIGKQIAVFRTSEDSLMKVAFAVSVDQLKNRQQHSAEFLAERLNRITHIETKMNELNINVYRFLSDLTKYLQLREANFLQQELPPIWESSPSVYPFTFMEVVESSFQQTLKTLTYYSKMSLWRIVIFRALIFLLCLIPIKIFNDQKRKNHIMKNTSLTFLDRYPKTATVVMGMVLSPFIFVNPPHAFLELLLLGLTFLVTLIVLKHYPLINKRLILLVILAFFVLSLINFFVTPTFTGRLVYTSAILLVIPIVLIYRKLPEYQLKNPKSVRGLLLFLLIHLVIGWILTVLGIYTLGRSVMLSGYGVLIITMILRIALFTLLDYLSIITYFVNKGISVVNIDVKYLIGRTKPLLMSGSFLFVMVAYLYNLNLLELIISGISEFMTDPRAIGAATFTWLSVLLFFVSIYVAFVLASILRNTFIPQHEATVEKRSNLGSFLLLLRLFVIISGFMAGILLSGLPLTNFTILLGALGVGIGFGLQNIVSNLISGLIIAFEQPFVVGDLLEFGSETGRVKEINLRATNVSTAEGADILIPNNTLLSQNLKNWTISSKQRFVELHLITRHETNPEEVLATIGASMDKLTHIVRPKSIVLLSEINETGFVFTIKLLITDLGKTSAVRSQFLIAVRSAFNEKGIGFARRTKSLEPD